MEGMWHTGRTDDREAFPESPPGLTCTFLLVGLCFAELCGPVTTGCVCGWFVNALLHPLHDQVQQRQDRLVHLRARRCARLKVRDPIGDKSSGLVFGTWCKPNQQQSEQPVRKLTVPVFISQLLGLFLLNLPLICQVRLVSHQHDIWVLTVGIGL